MNKLEELKDAYEKMEKECGFVFEKALNSSDGENWILIFKYWGVGLKMSIQYEFIFNNNPITDNIIFKGDPHTHFSFYCYKIIDEFISMLQKHRADKEAMTEFISYLKEINE